MKAPETYPGSEILVGTDGNIFAVAGTTLAALRRAGADDEWRRAVSDAVMQSTGYDQALGVCIAALDGDWSPDPAVAS